MADIQAEGLRAASDLLERVLEPDYEAPAARQRQGENAYAALLEAWAELLQRLAGGLASSRRSDTITVPVDAGAPGAAVKLRFEAGEAGESTSAEVWLHNGTSAPVGPLTLRCGALAAPDGTQLACVDVRFDPRELAVLPPRSSRAVLVSLAAAGELRTGVYRGTIQADGAPNLWLPIEALVEPC